jgi:hypothetical protein
MANNTRYWIPSWTRGLTLALIALVQCLVWLPVAEARPRSGYNVVPSNVSYDVCQRRLNRGQGCLYPYWYPYWTPDRAYKNPFWVAHIWPYSSW